MAPREQRENAMAPLEYTYALQYYAMNEQGDKVWKFATTTTNEVVSGLLRAKPGVSSVNLAEHGPRLLKKMLQMPGAENGWFRLVFWEGNVPNEELDDRRSCAKIYEEATIVSGSEQVAAALGTDSTEHPVFGLHAGMDRASVLDRLGPPTRSITMGEVLSRFTTVVGTPPSDTEAWLYVDTPPGHEIRVTITADGRLERAEVYVQSSGASKRMWSTDGKRR
jgi:hypothetical protein